MSSAVFLEERYPRSNSHPASRQPSNSQFSDGVFALGKSDLNSLATQPVVSPATAQSLTPTETSVKTPPAVGPTQRRFAGSSLRRARTNYTPEQLVGLEELFASNPYPGIDERERLADAVNLPEARVQVWFQNHRARLRRKKTNPLGSSPSLERPAPKPRPAKKAKRSHPVSSSSLEAEPSSSGKLSLPSPSSSPSQPHYIPACTQACCASTTGRIIQSNGHYLNGASLGCYPWSNLNATAFHFPSSYNPYAYLYPGTTPFLYDYAFPLPPTTTVSTTSRRELEK